MRALLDTCTLSEIRHPKGSARVKATVRSLAVDDVYVSVISVGELGRGIRLLKASKRKAELELWLGGLIEFHGERVLPVGTETAEIWGEIAAECQKAGRAISPADGLIAATAIQHGLHVVTRNVRDFETTGVLLLDPWNAA